MVGQLRKWVLDRRLLFIVIGGFNSLMGLVYFALLQLALESRIGYMGVLVASYAVATCSAYLLHRYVVFRVRGRFWRDFARFASVQVVALGINAIALPLLVEVGGLPVLTAQVIATVVTVALSYFAHSLFSFRRKPPEQTPPVPHSTETGIPS